MKLIGNIVKFYLIVSVLYVLVCAVKGKIERTNLYPLQETKQTIQSNSIEDPSNYEYVIETAFNLGIPVDSVTQEQFNERYNITE